MQSPDLEVIKELTLAICFWNRVRSFFAGNESEDPALKCVTKPHFIN